MRGPAHALEHLSRVNQIALPSYWASALAPQFRYNEP